jgi:undecaprenyl-diphosphatase
MLDYIILGAIQGIFEWIPISSQGVVAIASRYLIQDLHPVEIALFLHFGTFFSALIYFRKEWISVLTLKNIILLRFLIIATFISGAIGFILYGAVKNIAVGSSLLLLTGFGLLATAYFHKVKKAAVKNPGLDKSRGQLAIISGIAQGLSVIPGLSRSGATIFALGLGNLKPDEILKISYMMSAPVVLGMSAFLFIQNPALISETWPGLLFSFLFGIIFLDFMMKFAVKIDFFKFAAIFALLCFVGAGLELLI